MFEILFLALSGGQLSVRVCCRGPVSDRGLKFMDCQRIPAACPAKGFVFPLMLTLEGGLEGALTLLSKTVGLSVLGGCTLKADGPTVSEPQLARAEWC